MGLPLLLATSASRLALAQEGAGPPVRVLVWEAAQLPLAALDRPLRLTGADPGGCGAGATAANSAAGPAARDQAAGGSLLLAPGQLARLWLERGQLVVEAANGRSALPAAACYWLAVEAPGGGLGSSRRERDGSAAPEAAAAPLAGAPAAGNGIGAGATGAGAVGAASGAAAGTGASGSVGGASAGAVGGWTGDAVGGRGDLQIGERRYRGQLQILPIDSGLRVINHLHLEQYLASVVGSEMPASWPQAALRAQAVAARTYALRQRKPRALFDVTATTASQVYRGLEAETASTREAVAATRGQVLLFEGGLLDAVFHSSSGGASTENSGEIWNQQLPYLVSVPDLDDLSPVKNWQQTLAPELLRKAFGEIGGALRIEVLTTSASGRIRQARVTGPAGTLLLSGTQLRSRLGLRSTLVRFESVTLDPVTNRPLDPAAQPTWTTLPSSPKLAPSARPISAMSPGNTAFGNTAFGNTAFGNTALGNTAAGNISPGNISTGNISPGNSSGISVPLAGGSTPNTFGAINYRSIASGSATSGSPVSGAISPASKTALAISPLTASSAAAVAAAGNASQAGTAVGGYVPGMPTSNSLASLLPPPPLLPAIVPEPLQLTPPTLLAIGRGFGHGVGMSQWGAYGLARRGEDYQRILLHYYRGSELRPYPAALVSP